MESLLELLHHPHVDRRKLLPALLRRALDDGALRSHPAGGALRSQQLSGSEVRVEAQSFGVEGRVMRLRLLERMIGGAPPRRQRGPATNRALGAHIRRPLGATDDDFVAAASAPIPGTTPGDVAGLVHADRLPALTAAPPLASSSEIAPRLEIASGSPLPSPPPLLAVGDVLPACAQSMRERSPAVRYSTSSCEAGA